MLLKSGMKDKMLGDPRYRKLVEQQKNEEMAGAMKKKSDAVLA